MRKKLLLSFLIFSFLNSSPTKAQDHKEELAQIDKFLSAKYNQNTPGCIVGIVSDGKLIYNKGFGMANLDYGIPMNSQSVVNVMSVSKQFTAACIALLKIDGKISFDDDIRKYIPELPDYGQKITIDHLIRHTSGIRDYADLVFLAGGSPENIANRSTALELVLRQKELNFTPGDQYSYSNSGYLLLTYVIERISGISFPEFAKKNIFNPLGMSQSFFSDDPHLIVPNRVVSYGKTEDGSYFCYNLNDNRMGCGGLFTTVEDLYKWDQNFYDNKIGGETFNQLMLSLKRLNNGKDNDYALGNIIDRHEGFKETLHSGGLLGIRCKLSRFPTRNLSIIYLGNGSQEQDLDLYPIASLLLINKPLPVSPPENPVMISFTDKIELTKTQLEKLTGFFRLKEGNLLARISLNDRGRLGWMIVDRNTSSACYTESKTEFILTNGQRLKILNDNADSLVLVTKSGKSIAAKKLGTVSAGKLQYYTGTYFSEELRTFIEVSQSGEELVFKSGELLIKSPILDSSNSIQFNEPRLGKVRLQFYINDHGRPDSFLISTDRTNKIRFNRLMGG
ncbi:MAG TPA: serine hydrolase domain-containing protein [Puia sp.]